MKKKDFILNILLIFLVALAIFQSSLLWIKFPNLSRPSSSPQDDRQSLVKRLFNPEKTVINFAKNDHTVIYDSNDIYKQYRNSIFESFNNLEEDDFKEITAESYMELMNKPSIVFQFTNNLLSSTNLFGIITNSDDSNNLQEIYIAEDCLAYERNNKYFIKNDISFLEIKNTIEPLKDNVKEYVPYLNFKEKYDMDKNILTRLDSHMISEKLTYSKDISGIDKKYKTSLVTRFLNIDIDYVNQITRPGGTIYSYGDKYISFNDDGLIEYVNNGNFQANNLNLFSSLSNSIDFIISKLGTVENLKLVDVEAIEDNSNKGYKISFDYKENNMLVYPASEKTKAYVEIEIFSNHVKSFRQEYRKVKDQNKQNFDLINILPLEEIIYRNQDKFIENPNAESINYILSNIDSITEVYIENINDDSEQVLTKAIRIDFMQKEFFFSLKTGKFIMER